MGSLRLLPLKSEIMRCVIIFCEMCKNAAVEFDPRTHDSYASKPPKPLSPVGFTQLLVMILTHLGSDAALQPMAWEISCFGGRIWRLKFEGERFRV